jgi:predicted transposase/invertase (TIGR01784 family)
MAEFEEKYKSLEELETRFDKWLYVLRNLNRLDNVPEKLRERIFEKLFETAEIAKFTPEQVRSYEDSLKYYRDLKNSLDTAREEGLEIGRLEGKKEMQREIAKEMLKNGLSIDFISRQQD